MPDSAVFDLSSTLVRLGPVAAAGPVARLSRSSGATPGLGTPARPAAGR